MSKQVARLSVPGWLAGLPGATAALIVVGFLSIGFYASMGGLMIAAAIVTFYLTALAAAYLLVLRALAGPDSPGLRAGPAVYPPP